MNQARIQILIPVLNQKEELRETLNSIWAQDYERENIYVTVVDFGSKDGTYEMLLQYNSYHLGIYAMKRPASRGLDVQTAAMGLSYVAPGGQYSFSFVLYPGEQLYPGCIQKCTDAFIYYQYMKPVMVICETDILTAEGSVKKQKPLFEKERVIDGKTEMTEYVKRGYQHQIFEMKLGFSVKRKASKAVNEQRFWNKAANSNNENCAIYLPEVLACTKEVVYEDELEEILYRWEWILSMIRFYETKFGHVFDTEYEVVAKKNLSIYALWRSYCLYKRGAPKKDAEDCFMASALIDPKIRQTDIYEWTRLLIEGKDFIRKIEAFHEEEI